MEWKQITMKEALILTKGPCEACKFTDGSIQAWFLESGTEIYEKSPSFWRYS